MAILTREIILQKIKKCEVKIDPFDEKSVGPASIDLHLGNQFRVFKKTRDVYQVDKNADFRDITELIEEKENFVLNPGESVHGITIEKVSFPENICGWIEGKSSVGRLGLAVHTTASFIQPGISSKQVLEIHNEGQVALAIHPGIAICQIILEETKGSAKYAGRFSNQETP